MFQLTKPLILASNSPRRKQLLQETGFEFEVEVLPTDESFPDNIPTHEVAGYISSQKAEVFRNLHPEKIILTADTVVIIGETILNKPKDIGDAVRMLKILSGNTHEVTTAVSLLADDHVYTISDTALVSFRTLEETEINYYIEHYKPFDKAGAYGVQEWIGMVGINRIEGSFYTIMGLPVHVVYQLLKPFLITQS
ncbi:MAG: Maf family nucleotide pyrophosphatase [Dyadobacter sp.]